MKLDILGFWIQDLLHNKEKFEQFCQHMHSHWHTAVISWIVTQWNFLFLKQGITFAENY